MQAREHRNWREIHTSLRARCSSSQRPRHTHKRQPWPLFCTEIWTRLCWRTRCYRALRCYLTGINLQQIKARPCRCQTRNTQKQQYARSAHSLHNSAGNTSRSPQIDIHAAENIKGMPTWRKHHVNAHQVLSHYPAQLHQPYINIPAHITLLVWRHWWPKHGSQIWQLLSTFFGSSLAAPCESPKSIFKASKWAMLSYYDSEPSLTIMLIPNTWQTAGCTTWL